MRNASQIRDNLRSALFKLLGIRRKNHSTLSMGNMEQFYNRPYKDRSAGESKLLRLRKTHNALQLPEFSWFNLSVISGIQSKEIFYRPSNSNTIQLSVVVKVNFPGLFFL